MDDLGQTICSAFAGDKLIASGQLLEVALKAKGCIDRGEKDPILIFDDSNSVLIEIDFRGSVDDLRQRLSKCQDGLLGKTSEKSSASGKDSDESRGRGRPKLGVVAREVTLLPRHWDWLNSQPGGASVALRKLVESARKDHSESDKVRYSQECSYRFMSAMAGNLPGFEEATRALFARDSERFTMLIDAWPEAIRNHCKKLSTSTFSID